MKELVITCYYCDICETRYFSAEEAWACEKLEVRKSYGLKVGDRVRIEQHPISREVGKEAVVAIKIIRRSHEKPFHEEMVVVEFTDPPGKMLVSPDWLVKM